MTEPKKKYTLIEKLKAVGPGAMITASFIGPGTVTTATRAGAEFGYALVWTVIFSIIATILLQGMAAKIGIIAQRGLGEAILKEFEDRPFLKKFSAYFVGGSVAFGCAAYISGDLTGTSIGLETITGIPIRVLVPIIGVIVLLLMLKGSIKLLEKILTVLVAVMAVVFLTTMFVSKPNWGEVFSGAIPSIPPGGIIFIISMIGTTIVPYNFFIHAGTARDNWNSPNQLVLSKWDTTFSITIGGLITAAVVITSGTLMRGYTITSGADLSIQLEPLLGSWAKIFMSIGLFSAGLSSALASPLGASYTLAGLFGWDYDNSDKRFKYTNIIIALIGIVVGTIGFNPLEILLIAQALNGIILPIVAIYVVIIASSSKQLGKYKNSNLLILLGVLVCIITVFLGGYSVISAIRGFI